MAGNGHFGSAGSGYMALLGGLEGEGPVDSDHLPTAQADFFPELLPKTVNG